jgi:KaiC/GvpD/RAD55 family RecA-like ATPase
VDITDINELNDKVLRPGTQLYIKASGEKYLKGFSDIVSLMTREKGSRGMLVSTIWSANALSRRISLSKLPRNSMKIIDTVSLSLGSNIIKNPDFTFLPTPVPLESILVVIERLISDPGTEVNFLIFDSLTFLRGYYTQGQLNEFFHYILNRMLEEEISTFIIDQDPDIQDGISNLLTSTMDRTITISKGGGKK